MPDYRYYLWRPYAVRDSSSENYVQMGELTLMANGAAVTSASPWYNWNGTNTGNSTSNSNTNSTNYGDVGPSHLTDGNVAWKWFDDRGGGGAGVWRDYGQTVYVDQISWYTGNDATWRDPTSWEIFGSNDNSTWTSLWSSSDSVTTTRSALAGTWSLSGTKRRPGNFVQFF